MHHPDDARDRIARDATQPHGGEPPAITTTESNDVVRPLEADEARTVKATSAPVSALAGAAAGATAGLVTGPFGVIAAPIGAVAGAIAGALGGWFAGQSVTEVRYDDEQDAHYRALYEGSGSRPADRSFDTARPAYQLGHLAAHNPEWSGREFDEVEPELRRGWEHDLHARHGHWDAVRPYARDAFGHARASGAGARRDMSVIGSAGSAVDPVELERARHGEPSVAAASPGRIVTRDDATGTEGATPASGAAPVANLGERGEVDANTAHRRDPELH